MGYMRNDPCRLQALSCATSDTSISCADSCATLSSLKAKTGCTIGQIQEPVTTANETVAALSLGQIPEADEAHPTVGLSFCPVHRQHSTYARCDPSEGEAFSSNTRSISLIRA